MFRAKFHEGHERIDLITAVRLLQSAGQDPGTTRSYTRLRPLSSFGTPVSLCLRRLRLGVGGCYSIYSFTNYRPSWRGRDASVTKDLSEINMALGACHRASRSVGGDNLLTWVIAPDVHIDGLRDKG